MSDDKKAPGMDQQNAERAAAPQGPAEVAAGAEPVLEPAQLEAIIKALQVDLAALADTNLRIRAEMENLRKRFEREKAETAKYAISKFAQDVVNVGDNFQRAISAVPAGAAERDPALKSFLDGTILAEREFNSALERHGVVRLDPKGEMFNPKVHNAVMEQENRDVPAGTVLQVFQPGYMIDDRCLKPALVVVAKGGFKVPRAPQESTAAPGKTGDGPGASGNDPGTGDASGERSSGQG